jgi:mono/diheme cytochrome c family protein
MRKHFVRLTVAFGLSLLVVPAAMGQLPKGVTQQMIDQGKTIFNGQGICMACHGADAKGMPNLGTDLTDKEWTQGDGSFESIAATIRAGVSSDKSKGGTMMPPKGGGQINDDQLAAVAAYVWSLSNK